MPLTFGEQPTPGELERITTGTSYHARWAKRLLADSAAGKPFARGYPEYPVQVWRLGEAQLWIALGGEVCVDYALRCQAAFGSRVWVNGYANDVMAYIPSRRLWEEGGIRRRLEVYGLPATRWCADIEERIIGTVTRLVAQVRRIINATAALGVSTLGNGFGMELISGVSPTLKAFLPQTNAPHRGAPVPGWWQLSPKLNRARRFREPLFYPLR